jgi:hypothetical protein
MPKPSPQRTPDPLAGVVDRLLAQLPGLQSSPEPARAPGRSAAPVTVVRAANRSAPPVEAGALGMWIRVLLGLSLAVTMGGWPYSRECGLPLLSYLAAVLMVLFAGIWAATASWERRSVLAHVISLTLILYGIILTGSELLPRTGYAVRQATWGCQDLTPTSSIVLSRSTASD